MNKYEAYAKKKYEENKAMSESDFDALTETELRKLSLEQDRLYLVMWRRFDGWMLNKFQV